MIDTDLLEGYEPDREKIVTIDVSNMAYRYLYTSGIEDPTEKEFRSWKRSIVKAIMDTCKYHKPNYLVLAFDPKGGYWRHDIYKEYKGRRNLQSKTSINLNYFNTAKNEFFENFKKTFPNLNFIEVKKAEADDVIAVTTKYFQKDYDILNISRDRDFYQLLKYKNYSQYDGHDKRFIKVPDPKYYLTKKIFMGEQGESSDNIPKCKYGIGDKKYEVILAEGLYDWLNKPENADAKEQFELNTKLIDFSYIPSFIEDSILNEFKKPVEAPKKRIYDFGFECDYLENLTLLKNTLENIKHLEIKE